MKHLGKVLLVPISIGLVSGFGLVNVYAEDTSETVPVVQNIISDLSPLSSEGIVLAESNSDTTITDNYLILENPSDDMLRAVPKTIKVADLWFSINKVGHIHQNLGIGKKNAMGAGITVSCI